MPQGVIEKLVADRGFGFINGDDGVYYHLHRSEVLNGRYPLPGSNVRFYVGYRECRPRACYVEIGVNDE